MKCKACDRPAHARELCGTHYAQWRRGNTEVTREKERVYSRRRSAALSILTRRHTAEFLAIMVQLERAERQQRLVEMNRKILAERGAS